VLTNVVCRWQRGRSLARGWTDYSDENGVITVRIGETDRMAEYISPALRIAGAAAVDRSYASTAASSCCSEERVKGRLRRSRVPRSATSAWSPSAGLMASQIVL
jgi:hypothetical protein